MKYCRHCGAEMQDNDFACAVCGRYVSGLTPEEQEQMRAANEAQQAQQLPNQSYQQPYQQQSYQQPYQQQTYQQPYQQGYQQAPYQQMPYQSYQQPYAQQQKTNGFAIASLVLGICSFFLNLWFITPALAIIFAVVAKKQIAADPMHQKGGGLATAGLVCGIIGAVLSLIVMIAFNSIARSIPTDGFDQLFGEYLD